MKKVIASIVAMLAAVAMVACGNQTEVNVNEGEITITTSATTTTVTTTEVTTNNTTTSDVTTENVTSESEIETLQVLTLAEESTPETEQVTVAETEASTTVSVSEFVEPTVIEDWLVYKPSTHYAHTNTCRWNKGDAYRCDDFSELEVRICSECNPNVGEHLEYVEQANKVEYNLSDYEYNLLCQLIANEAGYASLIERAKIVGATMNACERYGWSVSTFVYTACVPYGFAPGYNYYHGVYAYDMGDAIDYYFTNGELGFFDTGWWEYGADSWSGCHSDGLNHFYRA